MLGRASIAHPDWPSASARPDFEPKRPMWSVDFLRSVDVGEPLIRYLMGFPGTVEGGRPGR